MARWSHLLWLLLPGFVACAASESSTIAPGGSDYGGQTGALEPPPDPNDCGPRLGPDQVLTLSNREPGFVAQGALAVAGPGAQVDAGAADAGASASGSWQLASASGQRGDCLPGSNDGGAEVARGSQGSAGCAVVSQRTRAHGAGVALGLLTWAFARWRRGLA